jgi:hypothetical protein
MADKLLSNPIGAFKTVTDFRTGKDADGQPLEMYAEVVDGIADSTLAVGQLVVRIVPTATQPMRIGKAAGTGGGVHPTAFNVAGVCIKAATAGQPTQYVKYGFCLVNVANGTPAIGDMGVPSATQGVVDAVALATGIAATTFAGNILGQFLGTKDSNNLAAFWYERV